MAVNGLDSIDTESRIAIFPFDSDTQSCSREDDCRMALLFSAIGNTIAVALLSVSDECDTDKSKYSELGKCDLPESSALSSSSLSSPPPSTVRICALHVVESSQNCYTIAVCTDQRKVYLVSMTIEPHFDMFEATIAFQFFSLFWLEKSWSPDCILRIHSAELLATMQPDEEGLCHSITIWTANPQTGCNLVESDEENLEHNPPVEYCSTEVATEYCSEGNRFLDFDFICPGFLDATPSLCTFSLKGAALFLKQGGNSHWMPAAKISYSTKTWSVSNSCLPVLSGQTFDQGRDLPRDLFPHLIPGLASVYSSRDEELFLRSDWHPDSLISQVCIDGRGARIALIDRVRVMLLWLCSACRDIPEGHLDCPLTVAPITILNKNMDEDTRKAELTDVLAALTQRPVSEVASEESILNDLQSALKQTISNHSRHCTPAAGSSSVIEVEENISKDLPAVLSTMDVDDLRLLWSLGTVALEPSKFQKLDVPGQLYLFSAEIFQNVLQVSCDTSKKSRLDSMPEHSTMIRKSTSGNDVTPRCIASAGVLAALLSTNQSSLRQILRRREQKMTWSVGREQRIPFWVRSDTELARIAEEIGQSIFRENRDIMECALFFIIAGKVKTLRNLAATDQSTSGKMFFKFITQHDFSGERGRRAAERMLLVFCESVAILWRRLSSSWQTHPF